MDVPAGQGEPAHEHADLRYFMATRTPEAARAENEHAPLRWLSLAEARQATSEVNLRESLARLERSCPAACGVLKRGPGSRDGTPVRPVSLSWAKEAYRAEPRRSSAAAGSPASGPARSGSWTTIASWCRAAHTRPSSSGTSTPISESSTRNSVGRLPIP